MADNDNDKLFQVSVKGLFFKGKKVMMMQEPDGLWEPPGGRVQKGEDLIMCLKRECREEIGLSCEVIGKQPLIVYSTIDNVGRARVMVYYKIRLKSLAFKPSDECVDIKFYTKDEIKRLRVAPQIKKLPGFL
jgi:8-oxo-dGTP pyrophosphatase MutT (NUDIX family)